MSPANKNLRDTLVRLNLCSDRDFRRSRRIVRKLARGIPAFDFLWVDALVQLGSLTPYQAKVLQSAPPEQLCIGPCVLLERLGSGRNSETYRARGSAGEPLVLKKLRVDSDESARLREQLGEVIEKTRDMQSPFAVAPYSLAEQASAIVVLSRFVAGSSCKDLLVRRGRFPADVVAEIARQVAHGCAALEARTIRHGQINLSNVKLTGDGNAVLVDAGIASAAGQSVLIRDDISPDDCDGIAPERIGTGAPHVTASEIYAFGCLLWQLLAGRPPFPTGDPLAKLAAHRSRSVPDVRAMAPDVPAPLAEAVRACTQHDPQARPASFAEIARRFGPPTASGRQRLARFLRRFEGAAPPDQLAPESPMRFPTVAVGLLFVVLSGTALFLARHGVPANLSRTGKESASKIAAAGSTPRKAVERAHTAQRQSPAIETDALPPLPPPNADGVIELPSGSFAAETFNCVGDLVIRGTGRVPATIEIRDQPLRASCRKFSLEHVIIRQDLVRSVAALLEVRSQELTVTGCTFRAEVMSLDGSTLRPERRKPSPDWSIDPNSHGSAIEWTQASSRDPDAGRIRVSDTVFATARTALSFVTPPSRVEIENSLKLDGGLLQFGSWSRDRDIVVVAQHLTLRGANWLCYRPCPSGATSGVLRLVLQDSAFDLKGGAAALIRFVSSTEPPKSGLPFVITGRDSVINPNVPIIARCRPRQAEALPVDAPGVVVEGLAAGEFQFVGPEGSGPRASGIKLASLTIPRQSDDPPGIVAARLASSTGGVDSYLEPSAH